MKQKILLFGVLCLCFAFTPTVLAQRNPVYAVLIGINQYQDNQITPLRFTDRDVTRLYKTLVSTGNVDTTNVKMLLNKKATRDAIKEILQVWLYNQLQKNSEATVIVYFSGHGWAGKGVSYWLPYDAKANDPEQIAKSAISHHDVNGWLSRLNSTKVILFVDACNSGYSWSGTKDAFRGVKQGFRQAFNNNGFNGGGRLTVASSQQNQYSVETSKLDGGHGVFSYSLIKALEGNADVNQDGIVTSSEVWTYLSNNVTRLAKQYKNYEQIPVLHGTDAQFSLAYPRVKKIAWLNVTSYPPASILVDGDNRGRTPKKIELKPGHKYQIFLQKEGYDTYKTHIELGQRATESLRVSLSRTFSTGTTRVERVMVEKPLDLTISSGIAMGLGSAAIVTGIILHIYIANKSTASFDAVQNMNNAAIGLYVSGGIVLVGGIFMAVFNPARRVAKQPTQTQLPLPPTKTAYTQILIQE